MRVHRTLFAFIAISVASGCALQSPPERDEVRREALPNLALPEQWAAKGGASGAISTGWLAAFKDERLDCKINPNDLVQVKSDAGLLLKAKDNVESATHQCTIRILGTSSYFYVSVDDCKAANNDHWFCGGHSVWTDLIVDRKRGTCIRKE